MGGGAGEWRATLSVFSSLGIHFNPSFTKPFGTHTFYQLESAGLPAISETVAPMNVKFCRVLETSLNILEM